MSRFEVVIGLEVHAQLRTRTKIFCGCKTTYGSPPNSQTCPVCLGHPGALPVLNIRAVELALRAALALDCSIASRSIFARKHYFYPDLPKGYQISQYENPLASGGRVPIENEAGSRHIGLIRIHLEEDAGKSIHDGMPDSGTHSYVDLNRSGTPLIEIVSQPEIVSPLEAYQFLQRLRSILRYAGICDGNLEEGSLRCDANISVRRAGETALGTRAEVKNLNSFRNVQRALQYEAERQMALLEAGREVVQESRLWDAAQGVTRAMRGKEGADDYRYFPEPDLPPLLIPAQCIAAQQKQIPELPDSRKRRFVADYGLTGPEAHQLTLEAVLADYFEAVADSSGNPRVAANYLLNDLPREQRLASDRPDQIRLKAEKLAALIRLVDQGRLSATAARQEIFGEMYLTNRAPDGLIREKGLEQLSDETALDEMVQHVLLENPEQVAGYRSGKQGLLGWLVGRVMQRSKGRANPGKVNELLRKRLKDD
jgi:aspartyl-tRNA(Asn)/glutamyl-tRNA(Gln) amidotransferase subunit B